MVQGPSGRRVLRVLLLIAVGALGLRLVYIAVAKADEQPLGDAVYYNAQANTLADGKGFADPFEGDPTAEHPPMTALVLAPVSWVVHEVAPESDRVLAHRVTMAVFGAGVVFVIGLVGLRVGGPRAAYLAAVIAALYPNLWINDGLVMSETLAALAVALAILLTYSYISKPTVRAAVYVGLVCGAAMLVRSELGLLLPCMFIPVVLLVRDQPLATRWRRAAAGVVAAGLVAAVWVVPNLVRFDKPVLFSTNDGLTLCGANVDPVFYGRGTGLWALDCAFYPVPPGDRSVKSNELRKRAIEYVGDHKSRVPIVVTARVARVWNLWDPSGMVDYNENEGREPLVSWLGFVTFWVLVIPAAYGAVVLRRRRVWLLPLLSQIVVVTITAAFIYGLARFRVPAEVSLVVLAAVGVDAVLSRRSSDQRSAEPMSAPPAPAS